MKKYIYISVVLALCLCGACRKTKLCSCEGLVNGKFETVYINAEHTARCKDITRMGYENFRDSVFVRNMHDVTCVDYDPEDE